MVLDIWFLVGPFVYFHILICANSEGSSESAWMRRLAWAFAGLLCDKYHNLMSWLNYLGTKTWQCYIQNHVLMRSFIHCIAATHWTVTMTSARDYLQHRIMCKTADKQYFVMNEPTCTLSVNRFVHFKYFGIVRYTRTFVILIVTCKGHTDTSMCADFNTAENNSIYHKNPKFWDR